MDRILRPDEEPVDELQKTREKFERGLEPLLRMDPKDEPHLLVVLKDGDFYHCHRYMNYSLSDGWDCSLDGQNVSAEEALHWLHDPSAI